MALFGEKYGDQVRVVSVGDWARELCGGTHAGRSGQLGVIKLLGESSIGSGVRRVEALVGADAYRFLAREHVLVAQLSEALKARPEELPERVNDIVERLRAAEKEIEQVRIAPAAVAGRRARGRRGRRQRRRGWSACASTAPTPATCARWRSTCAAGCQPGAPGAVVLIGVKRRQGRRSSRRSTTRARDRGRQGERPGRARSMPLVGGRGGGKDDVAQGGGTDASRIDEALARRARRAVAAGAPGPEPGAPRRTPRDRPRRRPDRGRAQRPDRASWRPRSRRCGAARATSARIARLVRDEEAVEVVVGLPRSLSGGEGPAAVKVREFAARLAGSGRPGRRCGSTTSG